MKREELVDGMLVVDTDDGMVMRYEKSGNTDFFRTKDASWHTCQFDISTFEPYAKDDKPGDIIDKNKI